MNAEFNWWLLIVGLVVGAGLVWLVVADARRREADVSELEREGEARWIAAAMTDSGRKVGEADVLDVLRLHAAYLAASPPDEALDEAIKDGSPQDDQAIGSDRAVGPEDRAASGERRWTAVPDTSTEPDPSLNRR